MKFLALAAALLIASAQGMRIHDDETEPTTSAQALGMRDGDFLNDQVDNFMEQAKNAVIENRYSKKK